MQAVGIFPSQLLQAPLFLTSPNLGYLPIPGISKAHSHKGTREVRMENLLQEDL